MPHVLVFGNFELHFELDGTENEIDAFLRQKDRAISRFLSTVGGEVESFELEGFAYGSEEAGSPQQNYYYNKQENNHKRV